MVCLLAEPFLIGMNFQWLQVERTDIYEIPPTLSGGFPWYFSAWAVYPSKLRAMVMARFQLDVQYQSFFTFHCNIYKMSPRRAVFEKDANDC
jgi:hypothetical protein